MTELTAGRIMKKAADCLDLCKEDFDRDSFEACVNRAYYSMFHSVQALLFISGVHVKTHVGAHSRFRELFIKTSLLDISLSVRLQRAFEKRQFSDYDYDEVAEHEASESVEDAAYFFDSVVRYLKENNHLQ